ncbi:MAG TPA: amidohydrolase [Clostridiaceae bacterium]|nr:amidohydrolase [Clostridiaceae bacterium]
MQYKIMDAHVHIYPDKIADKAVDAISKYYGITMQGSGTISDLLEKGTKAGISRYLVHSTATKPEQVKPINDFISLLISQYDCFTGFGTLHPDMENIEEEIDRMISMGIKGIKMHPEFQEFYLDEDRMIPLYKAVEGRLPLLVHMGDKNKNSSSPARLAKIIDQFPKLQVIAAHLGGYSMWDESLEFLAGKNLYMDTSSSLMILDSTTAEKIIRTHGIDKIVFGSDYPMWSFEEEIDRFLKLKLTETERKMIFWDNINNLLSSV